MEGYVTVEANAAGANGRALTSGDTGESLILTLQWNVSGGISGKGFPEGITVNPESDTVSSVNMKILGYFATHLSEIRNYTSCRV